MDHHGLALLFVEDLYNFLRSPAYEVDVVWSTVAGVGAFTRLRHEDRHRVTSAGILSSKGELVIPLGRVLHVNLVTRAGAHVLTLDGRRWGVNVASATERPLSHLPKNARARTLGWSVFEGGKDEKRS